MPYHKIATTDIKFKWMHIACSLENARFFFTMSGLTSLSSNFLPSIVSARATQHDAHKGNTCIRTLMSPLNHSPLRLRLIDHQVQRRCQPSQCEWDQVSWLLEQRKKAEWRMSESREENQTTLDPEEDWEQLLV
jgi:hypothetical protein